MAVWVSANGLKVPIALAKSLIAEYRQQAEPLTSILYEIQYVLGHVPATLETLITNELGLSAGQVRRTIDEDRLLRSTPAGKHLVRICHADSCRPAGAEDLLQHAERVLNCPRETTRGDDEVTLEGVRCLGHCTSAPVVEVDEQPYGEMTTGRLDALLQSLDIAPQAG